MNGLSRSLFLPFRLLAVSAILVNRTIDDHFGDSITGAVPTYLPDSLWAQGNICSSCNINSKIVDVDRVHNGTWHDSTYHPTHSPSTITASFTGQAVYVFNVIVNTVESTTTYTNLTFYVDDAFAGDYAHIPDPSSSVMYDVPVFSATLHPGQHTLMISAEGSNGSLVLFDYIIYTVDDEVRSQGTETPSLPRESTRASVGPSGPHSLSSSPTMFSTSAGIPRTPVTGARNSEPSGAPGSVTSIIAEPIQSATPEPSVSNPNEEHPAKSPAFAGGIVGGIVGGVVAILVILFVTFILRRYAHLLRWPRKPAPISKDEHVFKFDHHDDAGPSFPAEGGEPTTGPPLGSQHDTNSLSSLLPSSASRSPSPLASEDYTAIAPYSDPKFARRLTDVSKDSRPSSAPPGTEIGSRASSSLFPAEFTFVRASAAPPSHAVDVPAPALSVTSTARSVRYAELSRQIEALESAIQRLHYPGQPGSTPNPETQRVKRERLRALKGQIAELRTELAKEHRLAMEAAPKNKRKGKQPRQLAVVV